MERPDDDHMCRTIEAPSPHRRLDAVFVLVAVTEQKQTTGHRQTTRHKKTIAKQTTGRKQTIAKQTKGHKQTKAKQTTGHKQTIAKQTTGHNRGGDLGGLGGRSPQNLRWGNAHALVPQIFREVVLSEARESTNRVKNGLIKEFFSEIVVFLVKKGSYTTFNTVKKRKIRKKVIRNFRRENGHFFRKKRHSGSQNFFRPPNSAPGLRHCPTGNISQIGC